MTSFKTPILFLVFNRPDTTEQVFKKIREIKPKQLYIAADGPRLTKEGESDKCKKVRAIIDEGMDWDCIVHKLYREENLGCGIAVSTAITWFFKNIEEGIILEDDTVPDNSFFYYCEELLSFYRNENSIMHISGNNYAPSAKSTASYFFTRLPFIWGWATWRRAWNKYNFDNKYISIEQKKSIVEKAFSSKEIANYWISIFTDFHLKPHSYTWDFQWFLSIWNNNGLVIQPRKNLVKNIGFHEEATHTHDMGHHLATVNAKQIENIIHPKLIRINNKLEDLNFRIYFTVQQKKSYKSIISNYLKVGKLKSIIKKASAKVLLKVFPELEKLKNDDIAWRMITSTLNNCNLAKTGKVYSPFHISNSNIGEYSYVAQNSYISITTIGKFCSIGPNLLCGWGIHPTNGISTSPMFYSTLKQNGAALSTVNKVEERKNITIGNDVFIGANVTILDGVTIGDGAIIGAGAVVSKDIPPYAIAIGIPIQIKKYRFNEQQIDALMKIQWWDFTEDDLLLVEKYFFDVDAFINKFCVDQDFHHNT